MKFRKFLAFVLVFSMATQPGGVRFGYAEDTKAAEVENKAEESDELGIDLDEAELDEYLFDPGSREQNLEEAANVAAEEAAKTSKISGALAGAIAAGVAAVFAVVGTAGLMIYNGANNASEIKTLWTSDEGTLLSRLGKTISILFKGIKEEERYGQDNEEVDLPPEEEQASLFAQKQEVDLSPEEEQASLFAQKQKDNPLMRKILTDTLESYDDIVEEQSEVVETKSIETQMCRFAENEETQTCEAALRQDIASLEDYRRKELARLAKEEAERKAKEEAERLAKEEAERKVKEEAERLAKEEAERKVKEEVDLSPEEEQASLFAQKQKDNPLMRKILTDTLETRNDIVEEKNESAEAEQEESLENSTESGEGKPGQVDLTTQELTGVDSVDKNLCDEGKLAKEYCDNLEEKIKVEQPSEEKTEQINEVENELNEENKQEKDQPNEDSEQSTVFTGNSDDVEVEKQEENTNEVLSTDPTKISDSNVNEDDVKVEDDGQSIEPEQQPKTDVTSQQNNENNSRSENSTVVVASESKEAFIGPATKNAFELTQIKNKIQNTLNKLNNTCGLAAAGLQGELNEIDLVEAEATAKLDEVKAKLNSIMTRLNALDGDCSAIKSDKDYIVANWETVVSILDSSDASLRNDFGTLKLQRVTEGNLETLAEDYKKIAGRVKAILDNNKAISTSTGKISKKAKTEESLGQIIDELDLLYDELQNNYSKKDIKAVNKALEKFDNSELVKYFESEECSASDKEDRYEPYEELVKPLIAKKNEIIAEAKKNHSLSGVVEKLEELQANERSVVQKIRSLNRNTKAANDAIKQYENEAWFDKAYFEEWLQGATNDKIATEADLDLRANNVAAILNDLETNFSKKEIKAVNKALDEIDNSAIVKGACTQSRWRGLKKENKLTSEQCNTLKDKFVAERDRIVEEAKRSHSVEGLAEKLKNLYGKTYEYINDVAKLNADASEIEEIINEAGKFGLIDAEYFRKELAEKKTYLLENLKNQRTAMEAFLNDLKTNFGMENLNTLNSLDSEINKIISAFAEYEASYVSQYKEQYAAKREELKEMRDAGQAVAEMEKHKKELQIKLEKLKKSCENRPELCGKQ